MSQNADYGDTLEGRMLAALEADVSWCDDFGENTIRETAKRTAAICARVLSPQWHDKDGRVLPNPSTFHLRPLPHSPSSRAV